MTQHSTTTYDAGGCLLSPSEFASRAVGIPWAKWRADWSAMDCFGLVLMWHQHVLGLVLSPDPTPMLEPVEGEEMGPHILRGWLAGGAISSDWIECTPAPGAVAFMAWSKSGPTHCGVLLSTDKVLHALVGASNSGGSVRVSPLRALRAVYPDIRFGRHALAWPPEAATAAAAGTRSRAAPSGI